MKTAALYSFVLIVFSIEFLAAQNPPKPENYTAFNRKATFEKEIVYLDAATNDGILWLNGSNFANGTLELDIKGKDKQGQSFVGIAFHGKDDKTFDAVYFRPFNFKNPERNTHSVQYISMPDNDWSKLRNAFPGKYENKMEPLPANVEEWFHAKVVVKYPQVKVYVNGSAKPALEVDQISTTKQGKIGFWVGNGSDGWFKNLQITKGN